MIVECLEFDLDISALHDLVDLPVFLSADKLSMFVGELYLEANLVVESLYVTVSVPNSLTYPKKIAYFNYVEFHYHTHCRPDLMLKAVYFETHALEHNLSPSCNGYLL
jgi:hypothetical protein